MKYQSTDKVNNNNLPWINKYPNSESFLNENQHKILLIGMSGVGKTYLSTLISTNQKHYSVDYLIGTKYLSKNIEDSILLKLKSNIEVKYLLENQALKAEVLLTNDNLYALSSYVGMFGSRSKNGLSLQEFVKRQRHYLESERKVMFDLLIQPNTLDEDKNITIDTTGSFCELFNYPIDLNDPLIKLISKYFLLIYIEADNQLTKTLINRQNQSPKPICYEAKFFQNQLFDYCIRNEIKTSESFPQDINSDDINPKEFSKYIFRNCIHHRKQKYQQIANFTGITIKSNETVNINSASYFYKLIAKKIDDFNKN